MQREISGIAIECLQGDITDQPDIEAIVNAANAQLQTGGGVAGAIHRAAGPELERECRPLAPIRPGEAVITGAHELPNRYVIHCLGPVYGVDKPAEALLVACYQNAIRLAEKHEVESLAFPAISTGAFGYPIDSAARTAIKTIVSELPGLSTLKRIRMVLFDQADYELHAQTLDQVGE